jgi:hypothetical protein
MACGIDPGRAVRRQQTRRDGDGHEQHRRNGKRRRIDRLDAVQQ